MQPTVSGTAMMTMEPITSEQALHERIAASALLVLFGGAHCGVCQAIRPRIESMVAQSFPQVAMAYVDCAQAPAVCAQQGVFSLPVLRFYGRSTCAGAWAQLQSAGGGGGDGAVAGAVLFVILGALLRAEAGSRPACE